MLKIFKKWLYICTLIAFVIISSVTFFLQSYHSKINAYELIELRIEDVKSQIEKSRERVLQIKELSDALILLKAKMLAKLIYYDSSIISSQSKLEQTRKFLKLDEIYILDKKGRLIASSPRVFKGFDMKNITPSQSFFDVLSNNNFQYVQEITRKGVNKIPFQYAAVSADNTRIIQVGVKVDRFQKLFDSADIKNITGEFRVGTSGDILVYRDKKLITPPDNIKGANEKTLEYLISNIEKSKRKHSITIDKVNYFALVEKWEDYVFIGLLPKSEMFSQRNAILSYFVIISILILVIVYTILTILIKKEVIEGIYKINDSLKKITEGDLEEKVTVSNTPEFEDLSNGINMTVEALKNVVDSEARRILTELKLAKDIQMSSLPNIFPPFPDSTEFDVYALMETAKEVGGDFYDFFFTDADHLAFLVADVSGKGIPAAMFMMTTKTLLHNLAHSGLPPEKVFNEANRRICTTNEKGLFVTVFFGLLKLSTGELHCVNAGHNPPLLMRNNGNYEYLRIPPCLVLGGMEGAKYKSYKISLKEGDRIILYTDGVTESMNSKDELYGEKRLVNFVNKDEIKKSEIEECLKLVKEDAKKFSGNVSQTDDMALLLLEYHGVDSISRVISVQAKKENFNYFISWLEGICDVEKIPKKTKRDLLVIAEEVFINIASYGYPENEGELNVRLNIFKAENKLKIKFTDRGVPYNPLDAPEPDVNTSLEDRSIGGLGIFIIKKLAESINYRYKDGRNILMITLAY